MRVISLSILLFSMLLGTRMSAAPIAVQGGVDLSVVDWQEEPIVPLSGEWQFYWNQLLTPDQLAANAGKLTGYLSLENQWYKTAIPGADISRWGSATYHVRLYLNEPKELMLAVPILNSASRIWINGELMQDLGTVSLTQEGGSAGVRPNQIRFSGQKGENTLTLQISNHHFWYGGSSQPLRIGLPDALHKEALRATIQDALSFGFILFMAIYHIYIRFLLKRSNGALYFGLLSLALAVRMGFVGEGRIFYQIWPGVPMELRYLVEYLGVSCGTAFVMAFYRELYPHEAPRFLYLPSIYIASAWAAFIVVAPARYYPGFLELFQIIILLSGLVAIFTAVWAAKRRRDGSRLLMASNLLFFATVAHDILYHHRILNSVPLIHYGLMNLMISQALILAQRFARTFDRAERAEHEVTKLNQGLEQKILERTEQINTILSHVRSGFLLVDRNSYLQTGFTSSCETILNRSLKVGVLLPQQLGFGNRLEMQFMLAIQQIFDSDLPTEVAMQQLPTRFPIDRRMIGLQAAAVKSREKGQVTAVLLTINDVTDLVAAEEGLRRADILIHILEDQDAFRIFLADFKKDLEAAAHSVTQKDAVALHSIIHTMKGNAASFNLDDWVARLHLLEDKSPITLADIKSVADHVRSFLKQSEGILHLDFDQPLRSSFSVDQSDLNALRETLEPVASPSALKRLDSWSRSVKALPLKSYTTPLGPMVHRVAEQLQKSVTLVVEGADIKVDNGFAPLLTTLPHLIRNALVHGIEDPEDRGNKPAQATIALRFFSLPDGALRIEISDDGRGLDVEQIRTHAVSHGLIHTSHPLSEKETMELIFHPNFSTAERVTELAGRGMGLAAVAAAVQELNGHYEVRSEKNQGFHLQIVLPPPHATRLERVV
ncbi:MAG TPA: 7TM diverse intracellular signaling domain-containing protein [Oligoflexus sp.]|uniref:7TM diverse intracellular signaling domain-containing protein n=1 Tax=Oligoflexus sp. TaxID=1971216 RepID=UPI002D7F5CF3|nr:7TM diverse intracellular signaling domain-containing protein [Oligoflexus sp.]HET9240815.1 7TM diverse intracellular signaling domain-containing protein [Oligoflexus sp.]